MPVNFAPRPNVNNRCIFCGEQLTAEELDNPDSIYREVTSWVTGPKLQNPVLRTQTGYIAHAACIHKLQDGEAPDQEPVPGIEF